MVDTSKKSNIKCEHCHYWNRYKCHNEHSPKWNKEVNFWNRCKEFEWNERIKQEVKMKDFAIAELEKIKTEAEELIEHCDSDYEFEERYGIRLVVGILDNHISELKGENNE